MADRELRFSRTFDAPRELVFACMTDADHLAHFWGPAGVSAPRDRMTLDARPGGLFETVMVHDADGSEYPTRAVFDEVRPPELLVWTESHSGMRVRSEFVALGSNRTEVRIHQTYVPEAFSSPEARKGFESSLDRFAAYLAGLDALSGNTDTGMAHDIASEFEALADLLEAAGPAVWDAPSLCEGWRAREVVAHMTMPVRYDGPAFMAELESFGGDFIRLSNTVAARDGTLPVATLLAGLRSPVLHAWQPPGGGHEGALVHCVIHTLDIVEAVPLDRRVPEARIRHVLDMVATGAAGRANLFGLDLSDVELRADDLEWSSGSGTLVTGSAQALAVAACGRLLPPGRLRGDAAPRFSRP